MCLTLRQTKIVKTKLSLATTFVEKLRAEKFDAISIKDVCKETDVSEATFFNYFPQKIDAIAYLLKIKIFKTYWTIRPLQKSLCFTECIEKTFELFAEEIKHPYIFFEVLSLLGKHKSQMASFPVSYEELQCIYPECKDIEKIPMIPLLDFFKELVQEAINKNKIPTNIDAKTLSQFLMTILTGVPLSIPLSEFGQLTEIYKKHLSMLWKIFQL